MTRRALTIVLHWGTALLLLVLVKGGTAAPALRWVFVGGAGLWVALALGRGMLGRPGPKLAGWARAIFAPLHWGMYALLATAAALNAADLLGYGGGVWAWRALLVLLVAAMFHAIYHLWRHTTLNDGALRMMLPRAMHRLL
ncbi:MAG: hypothetical protein GW886_15930 [Rhodobacterales bacterium]|nr:hypothetical protein [Rhodobacterales bacterium]NCT12079.1 hypothetical protein [Rhodobacterales bacterium]